MIASRKLEDVERWLKTFKNIKVVSRDGSKTYKKAIDKALPDAIQVSDRFHLLQNLTLYAKKELFKLVPYVLTITKSYEYDNEHYDQLKKALNNKSKPTEAQSRKKHLIAKVNEEYKSVGSCRKVALNLKINRATVKKYIEGFVPEKHKSKYSSLSKHKREIIQMIKNNESTAKIHNMLVTEGINTKSANTRSYVSKIKTQLELEQLSKTLTHVESVKIFRSEIIKLLYNRGLSDLNLTENERTSLKEYINKNFKLYSLLTLITDFRILLFSSDKNKLDVWLEKIKNSKFNQLKSFCNGVRKDYAAVCNAITLSYSNGKIEGKINKLKKIKREMYGRASFTLLRSKIFLNEIQPN